MKAKKIILVVLGVIMLLAGIAAGVYFIREQQLTEKKAVVPGGVATMYLEPSQATLQADQTINVAVMVNSGTATINQITAVISFPSSASFIASQLNPNPDITGTNDLWSYQRTEIIEENGNTNIEIIMQYNSTQPYNAFQPFAIAFFNLRALPGATGSVTLDFDQNQSKIANTNVPDLLGQTSSATFTVGAGGGTIAPSLTPTSPAATLTPSLTPQATQPVNSPTPSRTPTPTATLAPGQPTNTPGPNATPTPDTRTKISVTSPAEGATLTDSTPTFTGTAAANARIVITVNSANTINGTATANASGAWTYTVPTALANGNHSATFVAYDLNDDQSSSTVNFIISAGTASSGSQTTTGDGTSTLPTAGTTLPTLMLIVTGITLLGFGLILFTRP